MIYYLYAREIEGMTCAPRKKGYRGKVDWWTHFRCHTLRCSLTCLSVKKGIIIYDAAITICKICQILHISVPTLCHCFCYFAWFRTWSESASSCKPLHEFHMNADFWKMISLEIWPWIWQFSHWCGSTEQKAFRIVKSVLHFRFCN